MSARDKLVYGTIDLMQRRGVSASGLSDILEHSDVSRRSVYLNFPGGKPELVAAATEAAGAWITAQVEASCAEDDPVSAVSDFVEQWRTMLGGSDFEAGCPVTAAAMARSVAPAAADAAATIFDTWRAVLADALTRRQVAESRATTLATMIVAAVEGAVLMAVAQQSMTPLTDVEQELIPLLRSAVPSLD
ncbi:TetR/AcrR family transcriptional regulator [Williamsia herbipolensis]|uniref:TetR/AcrR family transcriptional regulator n=1 Tax=Williamsia herbipolensis TaxID=1603258 RepID=UPI0005F7B152|nr:TetR/AcrR family transcriptional regulator [Williamsia herbipolensis]